MPGLNPRRLRRLQAGLGLSVVFVAAAVFWTLRRPPEAPPPPPQPPAPAGPSGKPAGARSGDVVYSTFREGRENLVLRAKEMVGSEKDELRLKGVELTFAYTAQGEKGRATVTGDECRYVPALQKAAFRGHVVLKTEDGFVLETEALNCRGDKGLARSEEPVRFSRKAVSGSSTGFVYNAGSGTIELSADVVVRVADPDRPVTEIRSGSARLEKQAGTLYFLDGVDARQGQDRLRAKTLTLKFSKDERVINRAYAEGDAELTLSGAASALPLKTPAPQARAAAATGPRILTGERLEVWFRPDRSLEEIDAGADAQLLILPGPRDPHGPRRLRARVLTFRLDGQGRLYEVQGQKTTSFVSEPKAGSKGPTLQMHARNFLAHLDPASGEIRDVAFQREVAFERGTQKATGERGDYDGTNAELVLRREPELLDQANRSRLTAEVIEIHTRSGDVFARGGVHHTREPSGRPGAGGLLDRQGTPALFTSDAFAYDAATHSGQYQGRALLRSGRDEVRAPLIKVSEGQGGRRTLWAEQGVVSRLHPAAATGAKPAPPPVEARAQAMSYEEAAALIVYTGDVALRQGELLTRSPRAELTLTRDGGGLDRLVAGEPVELRQGQRKASGARATYTPADDQIVVVGPKVVLTGPGQEVQGRSLTFHVGDDRILIDGREEVRTETVFRKEPAKP